MGKSQLRYGKRLIQAWLPEDLLNRCCTVSTKGFTETITEALNQYAERNKSELELLESQYESAILEATRLKAKIDELTKINLKETKIQIDKGIKNTNKHVERQLSEKERNEIWEGKIKPLLKKKISESGIGSVLSDERLLNNFSKGLGISTGELKEKISTEWGVV
ncbi:MAG TPA: hypothetical protein PKH80_05855 [Methanofastidiosum sp.]|nr:hypothetical protein [Methanofastidiosum sp.]HNU61551.1 hypothetical protein [Methanofastidiosum sp.]